MSTATSELQAVPAPSPPAPRPRYSQLLYATISGLFVACASAWVIYLVLGTLKLVPRVVGGPLRPWVADGPWAWAASAAWCVLFSTFIAAAILRSSVWRNRSKPALGWVTVAIAIGVFGPFFLHTTRGIHVLLAVAVTPLLIAQTAYGRSGAARAWAPGWRGTRWLLAAALAVLVRFLATHTFSNDGSSTGSATAIELDGGLLPTQVASVSATAPGVPFSLPGRLQGSAAEDGDLPDAPGSPNASADTRWPVHVGSREGLWVSFKLPARPACASGVRFRFRTVTIRYKILGISTQSTVRLQQALSLRCP